MQKNETYDGPRIWKQLVFMAIGPLPVVVAYALPSFRGDLDLDREADLRREAVALGARTLSRIDPDQWVDRPYISSDRNTPALLFSAAFIYAAFGLSCGVGTLEDEQPALRHSAAPPSGGNEGKSRIAAPDSLRINEGVMPLTRPAVISDCVSLSDKLGREDRTLVSEERAFDAFLFVGPELGKSPSKHRVAGVCAEDDFVSGADEQTVLWSLVAAGIVPSEQLEAGAIAVLGEIPERLIRHRPAAFRYPCTQGNESRSRRTRRPVPSGICRGSSSHKHDRLHRRLGSSHAPSSTSYPTTKSVRGL